MRNQQLPINLSCPCEKLLLWNTISWKASTNWAPNLRCSSRATTSLSAKARDTFSSCSEMDWATSWQSLPRRMQISSNTNSATKNICFFLPFSDISKILAYCNTTTEFLKCCLKSLSGLFVSFNSLNRIESFIHKFKCFS